jgi:hypothetical protein
MIVPSDDGSVGDVLGIDKDGWASDDEACTFHPSSAKESRS